MDIDLANRIIIELFNHCSNIEIYEHEKHTCNTIFFWYKSRHFKLSQTTLPFLPPYILTWLKPNNNKRQSIILYPIEYTKSANSEKLKVIFQTVSTKLFGEDFFTEELKN